MATEQVYDFASLQLASPKSLLFAGFLSFPVNMLKQYLGMRRNSEFVSSNSGRLPKHQNE